MAETPFGSFPGNKWAATFLLIHQESNEFMPYISWEALLKVLDNLAVSNRELIDQLIEDLRDEHEVLYDPKLHHPKPRHA